MHVKSDPWVLGISASHNGAVCLLKGDEIVVAIQEERLSRAKRHRIFGGRRSLAIEYCFEYAGIGPQDLSMVVLSVQDRLQNPAQDLEANPLLQSGKYNIPTLTISHHLAHAVAAFATSGFEEAAVLVVDGVGSPWEDLSEEEKGAIVGGGTGGWEIISLYSASGTKVVDLEKHMAPNGAMSIFRKDRMPQFESLGGMFAAASVQIFGNDTEAGKVMGLAPYGESAFPASDFFDLVDGRFIFKDTVPNRFLHNDRWPLRKTEYESLSASTQEALEEALFFLVDKLREAVPSKNFCYAGGVALNSVANEYIIRDSGFEGFYIMPAAEDSGPAIGAAYHGLWQLTGRNGRRMLAHDAVGRPYSAAEIDQAIDLAPSIERVDSGDAIADAARLLTEGKIVGWFQGRSELGPRALGQRSILCDPRRPDGKETLNSRVKHREAFRPFAPAVMLEEVVNWFDLEGAPPDSPFMLRVCDFTEGKADEVPAVVHVDGTGRLQTVCRDYNGPYYEVVAEFNKLTGVPIILNTSFNVMGEPIVESPEDALWCMLRTGVDYCVLGDRLVTKSATYEAKALTAYLERVADLKTEVSSDSEEPLGEAAINQVFGKIHQATAEAIPEIEEEISRHLGSVSTDLRGDILSRFWQELLSEEVWQALADETRTFLVNTRFLYSNLVKHSNRNVDWMSVTAELILAMVHEMNHKLIHGFVEWIGTDTRVRLQSLRSNPRGSLEEEEWLKVIDGVGGEPSVGSRHSLSLGVLSWSLNGLSSGDPGGQGAFQGEILTTLREFVGHLESRSKEELFKELPQRASLIVGTRDSCLRRGQSSGRNQVEGLLPGIQWLLPKLAELTSPVSVLARST